MFVESFLNSIKKLCCCSCGQQLDEDLEDNFVITENVNESVLEQSLPDQNVINFIPVTTQQLVGPRKQRGPQELEAETNRQEPKPLPKPLVVTEQPSVRRFNYFVDKNVDGDNCKVKPVVLPRKQSVVQQQKTEHRLQQDQNSLENLKSWAKTLQTWVPATETETVAAKQGRVLQEIPQVHQTITVHEEVPEKPAEFYRRKALKHLNKKRQLYQIAHQCKRNGQLTLADQYFKRAKQQAKLADKANNHAAAMVLKKNYENHPSRGTIDLHHLYVKEALEALDRFLDDEILFLRNDSLKRSSLRVITGRGKHSTNGIPKIKPAVIARLEERNLKYNEINAGYLRVVISKNSDLGNNAPRAPPLRL